MPRRYKVILIADYKLCSDCEQWLHLDNFHKNRAQRDGFSNGCKSCMSERKKQQYRSKPQTAIEYGKTYRSSLIGASNSLLYSARVRAKKRNIECSLSREWIKSKLQAGICERSGIPFNMNANEGKKPFAPSLDKVDNNEGYNFANTAVVCDAYNRGKGPYPDIDFIAMCCAVAERHSDDPAVIQRLKELRNAEF